MNFAGAGVNVRVRAIVEGNSQRYGANVEVLVVNHADRLHYVGNIQHVLYPVHGLENICPLNVNVEGFFFPA